MNRVEVVLRSESGVSTRMGDLYKVKVVPGSNPGSAVVKSNVKLARLSS